MDFSKELKGFSHAKITFEQPMKKFTTLGVGGCADFLVCRNAWISCRLEIDDHSVCAHVCSRDCHDFKKSGVAE